MPKTKKRCENRCTPYKSTSYIVFHVTIRCDDKEECSRYYVNYDDVKKFPNALSIFSKFSHKERTIDEIMDDHRNNEYQEYACSIRVLLGIFEAQDMEFFINGTFDLENYRHMEKFYNFIPAHAVEKSKLQKYGHKKSEYHFLFEDEVFTYPIQLEAPDLQKLWTEFLEH